MCRSKSAFGHCNVWALLKPVFHTLRDATCSFVVTYARRGRHVPPYSCRFWRSPPLDLLGIRNPIAPSRNPIGPPRRLSSVPQVLGALRQRQVRDADPWLDHVHFSIGFMNRQFNQKKESPSLR